MFQLPNHRRSSRYTQLQGWGRQQERHCGHLKAIHRWKSMLDYPHFLLSCYNQRTPDYIFPKYKLVQPCRFSVKRPNALLPNLHWEQYVPWNLPLGEKPNTFSVQNKIYLWSTIPSGDIHVQFFCQWFLLVILTGVHPSKPKMHNFDYAVNGTSAHKSIISLSQ